MKTNEPVDYKTFFKLAMHHLCDCIVYNYMDEEQGMCSGWLCKPSDCKHLKDGVSFWTNTGTYQKNGKEVTKLSHS